MDKQTYAVVVCHEGIRERTTAGFILETMFRDITRVEVTPSGTLILSGEAHVVGFAPGVWKSWSQKAN